MKGRGGGQLYFDECLKSVPYDVLIASCNLLTFPLLVLFFFPSFSYLFTFDRELEHEWGVRTEGEGEGQTPVQSPTPGSIPEP